MTRAATGSYSRVTVVSGTRHVDLALPAAVPLSAVMPQLLRFCDPEEQPHEPVTWTLGRLGGASLSLARSIADAAVADGEVLELRATGAATQPAYVEDVRDAVEDAVDDAGHRWSSRTTLNFAFGLAAGCLAAAILLPEARAARDGTALSLCVGIAALALVAAWWAGKRTHHVAASALAATAVLWGGLAGWLASLFPGWPVAVSMASASVAALATAAAARATTKAAVAHLAATAVWCAAAAPIGVFALAGFDPLDAARIVAVLAVLVIGVLPRLSLTVGGLAGADYRVRNAGQVSASELTARIRHSDTLLHGSLFAVATTGLAAGLFFTFSGLWWDRLLGLAVGLGLLLRSRIFTRVPHILPLRAAGLIVLIGQTLLFARQDAVAGPWLVAIAAGAAAVIVAVCAVTLSDIARARVKQVLNLAEVAVVAMTIPLAAGGLGLYRWVDSLF